MSSNLATTSSRTLRAGISKLAEELVERGLPPALVGYRRVRKIPFARFIEGDRNTTEVEVIHPGSVSKSPLPKNFTHRHELPDNAGWWGYSFRDVPERHCSPTIRATVPDALVVPCNNSEDEFWVSVFDRSGASLELREISFRPWQAGAIRGKRRRRIPRATWVLERVYHNHSHWLTAHLPKILLLKERGELAETLWPENLPRGVAACLRLYGIDLHGCPRFGPNELLQVDELTLLATDRFRPGLLRKVREHCPVPAAAHPTRKVYISRAKATRRRLLNEDQIWPLFEAAGFESVLMEELSFEEQVRLMRETAILAAPHGAGLTNMMFCPEGADIIELADLSFPNPNFYAVASAMRHRYWLIPAESAGDCHPLLRDMRVEPAAIKRLLEQVAKQRESIL